MKIKIGAKEYPIRMTTGAIVRFKRETGKSVEELDNVKDFESSMRFIYECMASACRADDVDLPIDFDKFLDSLDLSRVGEIQEALFGASKENSNEDEPQKKSK